MELTQTIGEEPGRARVRVDAIDVLMPLRDPLDRPTGI
jgi:hypothetical protein